MLPTETIAKNLWFVCSLLTDIWKQNLKQEWTGKKKVATSTSWKLNWGGCQRQTGSLWGSLHNKQKNNWEEQNTNSSLTCFSSKAAQEAKNSTAFRGARTIYQHLCECRVGRNSPCCRRWRSCRRRPSPPRTPPPSSPAETFPPGSDCSWLKPGQEEKKNRIGGKKRV